MCPRRQYRRPSHSLKLIWHPDLYPQACQGLTLTSGGVQIYEQARHILREAGIIVDLANDITDTIQGVITVGYLSTLTPVLG